MLLSVIIPCYNSEATISEVIELTRDEIEREGNYQYEFVLVNDFSKDNTFEVIRQLAKKYPFVKGLNLAKNFGQHNALMAALNYAQGDIIIGMDDDLQTHPSQMFKLIHKLDDGYDLVYGKYPEKKHSFFRNIGSKFNDFTVRKLIGKPKGLTACSFWVARKFVRDEIIHYDNYNAHLQGLFLRTTNNITNVDIEHFKRKVGTSNYTIGKLIRLWMGCLNFSILPLRLSMFLGILFSFTGFLAAIYILINKMLHPITAIGWSSTMCAICFFSGIILLVLGMMGEYIGRILMCINHHPQFVIREMLNVKKDEEHSI